MGFIDVLPLIEIECLKLHAIVKVHDGILFQLVQNRGAIHCVALKTLFDGSGSNIESHCE